MNARRTFSRAWMAVAMLTAWHLNSGVAAAQNALPAPWQQADVGDVGLAGSATQGPDGDLFINGAGSDIWGAADSFHFAYRPIEDGVIDSEPPSQDATNPFAKVGLMIRLSLDPGAPHVVLDVKPNGEIEFMTRQTQGGQTTYISGSTAHGQLQLTRSNGTVTGAVCSFNTNSCQAIGSVPFPSGFALTGAIITSHDPSVLNHGAFAANVPTVITLPSPWSEGDIGNVGTPGWAVYQNGTFTVAGAGADIWGATDAYHAVESFLGADSIIIARVTAEHAANTFAKAGVIMNSNAQSGPTVILDVRPNGEVEFMARSSQGGQMAFIAGSTATLPVWLKLQRTGSTFTGRISSDGNIWQNVGSTNVSMPTNINVSLAVTSHDTSGLNTSTFDHVTVASANTPRDIDIGDVGVAGSYVSQYDVYPGLFSLSGAGADIWGTSDAFNFFYTNMLGDGVIQDRVMGFTSQNLDLFAKAGVMIRETVDASSAHVILDVRPNGQVEFMMRSATGEQTTFLAGATATFPVDLNLTRSGSTITAMMSTNGGGTWSTVGSVSVSFDSDVLKGAIVSSHRRGVLATADIE
jgi:hypothetical protein